MDGQQLAQTISNIPSVAPHSDYILSLIKPSVEIELDDQPIDHTCSRFGGQPYLPSTFEWPTHEVGEYHFLGQFNFAEVENAPLILPKTGLLSLFYAYDEEGEVFWGDDDYILGFYSFDLSPRNLDAKGVGVEEWEAEIDDRVAHLYGLTDKEMKIIRGE